MPTFSVLTDSIIHVLLGAEVGVVFEDDLHAAGYLGVWATNGRTVGQIGSEMVDPFRA